MKDRTARLLWWLIQALAVFGYAAVGVLLVVLFLWFLQGSAP